MNRIGFEIDGQQRGFHEVWVHLQDVSRQRSVDYRISVPENYVRQVFDPYNTKLPESSWAYFIKSMILDLGTFIVEGFIEQMAAIVGIKDKVYVWVIATVDEVAETKNGIELTGRAVPFVPRS